MDKAGTHTHMHSKEFSFCLKFRWEKYHLHFFSFAFKLYLSEILILMVNHFTWIYSGNAFKYSEKKWWFDQKWKKCVKLSTVKKERERTENYRSLDVNVLTLSAKLEKKTTENIATLLILRQNIWSAWKSSSYFFFFSKKNISRESFFFFYGVFTLWIFFYYFIWYIFIL